MLRVPLAVAAVTMCPAAAPAAAAGDSECAIILLAADRLETALGLLSPAGTPPYLAGQIRNA